MVEEGDGKQFLMQPVVVTKTSDKKAPLAVATSLPDIVKFSARSRTFYMKAPNGKA